MASKYNMAAKITANDVVNAAMASAPTLKRGRARAITMLRREYPGLTVPNAARIVRGLRDGSALWMCSNPAIRAWLDTLVALPFEEIAPCCRNCGQFQTEILSIEGVRVRVGTGPCICEMED